MSLILQIETATTSCSVALTQNGKVLAFKEVDERGIHARLLTLFIDEVIKLAKVDYADLDAIAVSCGPGSYTGLRIGISTAKGLCYALDKPMIAVETLSAMASGVTGIDSIQRDENTLLCPMIDARRMEVYTAVYTAAGKVVQHTSAAVINPESFSDLLANNKILFFGDGAEKCIKTLSGNTNALFLTDFVNSATHLTRLAAQKFASGQFEDVAHFEPYYLKDFIAGKKAITL